MFQQSCKKIDNVASDKIKNIEQIEAFLKLPEAANQSLLDITNVLRKQLLAENYIDTFKRRFGHPLWQQSMLMNKKDITQIWIIPLVKEGTTIVTGFMYAKSTGNLGYKICAFAKKELINILKDDSKKAAQKLPEISIFARLEKNINNNDSLNLVTNKIFAKMQKKYVDPKEIIIANTIDNESVCTALFIVCSVCHLYNCPETQIIWICEGDSGGGGGEIPGGLPLPIGTPHGGGGGNSVPGAGFSIAAFNTNDITDPCISSILNLIDATASQRFILKKYQEYVNTTPAIYKYRFAENNSLVGNNNSPVASHTDYNILSNGSTEMVITLNPTYLQNASKEFVAQTILHELMHSFYLLEYSNSSQAQQHQSMLNNDIGKFALSLNELFPNLSATDALALALQGYDDITVDPATNSYYTVKDNFANNTYGMSLSYARPLALDHFNGTKGIPCP